MLQMCALARATHLREHVSNGKRARVVERHESAAPAVVFEEPLSAASANDGRALNALT